MLVGGLGLYFTLNCQGPQRARFSWDFFLLLNLLLHKLLNEKYECGGPIQKNQCKEFIDNMDDPTGWVKCSIRGSKMTDLGWIASGHSPRY